MLSRTWVATMLGMALVAASGAQERAPYSGLWWVSHSDGAPLQLRLYPDGTAWSDYPSNNPGRWSVEHHKAVCEWADGWKEVLFYEVGEGRKWGYKPGASLSTQPTNRSRAYRASESADGWFGISP